MALSRDISGFERDARESARTLATRQAPWMLAAARIGYAARGVVHLLVGLVAAQVAVGARTRAEDTRGALASLLEHPAGRAVLWVIAAGLFAAALWRLLTAIADSERKGSGWKGMAIRAGYAGRALLYSALAVATLRLALDGRASGAGGDAGAEEWTGRVLALPLGQLFVALAGAGIIAYGVYRLYRSFDANPTEKLDLSDLGADARQTVERLGRFGTAARGVVFGVIGSFLIRAAWRARAEEAGGLAEAFRALERSVYGPWLLGAVALGFVAYGCFQFVQARYRRLRI